MDTVPQCCFAMVIRVWGRLILGSTRYRMGNSRSLTCNFSSLVIDHFYGSGPDVAVAGLYCDYLDQKEQTASNVLGAILKQLVGGGNTPEAIGKAFEDAKDHFDGVRPQVQELVNMLRPAIEQRRRVVICIDGLDESLPAHRNGLLRSLKAIERELPNVRLFLTGRPFIREEMKGYFSHLETVSISPTKGDTKRFLEMKLDEDQERGIMNPSLRADVMKIIPKTISKM